MIKPNLRTNDLRSAIKLQSEKVLDTTSLVNKSLAYGVAMVISCNHHPIMAALEIFFQGSHYET